MATLIGLGADFELRNRAGDTALLVASRIGRLSSVMFLVRLGATMNYTHEGQAKSIFDAAQSFPNILQWLLVDRWTDQGKLTSQTFNSETHMEFRLWTGVRTVEIPLRGRFERPMGSSLMEHAKHLHRVANDDGWRCMVPLGWETVAHLVPLSGEGI